MTPLLVLLLLVALGCHATSPYCFGGATFANNGNVLPLGSTLRHVMLLTRHGDRVPIYTMPTPQLENVVWNCSEKRVEASLVQAGNPPSRVPPRAWVKEYMPGREPLRGNCAIGQLTEQGAAQHVQLGGAFRRLYVDTFGFLPSTYNRSTMWVRSTDVPRTVASAFNFVGGLYPGLTGLMPLAVTNTQTENMLGGNEVACPALKRALKVAQAPGSPYMQYYNSKLGAIADRYSALWGVKLTELDMEDINDVLRSRDCHALALPPNMTQADADAIMSVEGDLYFTVMNNTDILRWSVGGFMQDMLADQMADLATPSGIRFRFYSAHDSTMLVFLEALRVFSGHWPPYASHAVVETWLSSTGVPYVVFQYDGQSIPVCKSGLVCPLAEFQALLRSMAPSSCD